MKLRSRSRICRLTLASVASAWIAAATVALADAARTLTPHDIAKFREVTSVALSPDGRQVAYTLRVQRDPFAEEDGPAWEELHVVDAKGKTRPYVTGEIKAGELTWTPDGESISFLAKREGDEHTTLYRIPISGGEAQRVLTPPSGIKEYTWSPDGSQVAFLATEAESAATKERRKKGFDQEVFEEDTRHVRIWIHTLADPDTVNRMLDVTGTASELHWSPTDSRLVCAIAPTPHIDDHYMKRRIRVIDAVSGAIVSRIENPGKIGQVSWSPDGQHLAVVSAADYKDPKEGRLMVVPASGGPLTDLLPDLDGHVAGFAWSDPNRITYLLDQGVWTFLGEVSLDGPVGGKIFASPQVLDIGARAAVGKPEPDAIFTRLSLMRSGRYLALVGESARHPREVFWRDGAGAPVRLTDCNPWLSEFRLARQEVVRYTARDGLELEGVLIHPLDEQPGQRYPMIMKVHGGPESHIRNDWATYYASPGQMAAARGIAVFQPNYRGSTGRGVTFSKTSQGDPAGKEFDDIVDAIDHFIATGFVDSAKVGITGGSYGGYASAWGATYYSDRYAASVMSVGLSDLISKIGTTDIPEEMLAVHYTDPPWSDWQRVLKRSPVFYADQSHTPTLILHGKSDTRVNYGQSLELYRQLKVRGQAPVRLILYPGEKHGNSDAAARLDYSLRMMRWLEHYLVGPGGDPPPRELEYQARR